MNKYLLVFFYLFGNYGFCQDLGQGYIANDLNANPMQPFDKPDFLEPETDPTFTNTTIRRITDAGIGNFNKPMYSTIQAWNADESLMIVYAGSGAHHLLDGQDYSFMRIMNINPDDIEAVFWHFTDPDILFYLDNNNDDFISYNVVTQTATTITNLRTISACPNTNAVSGGNDIQMMSWDSDVVSFRCGNDSVYYYRISTDTTTQFNISNVNYTAPMPFPSGNLFYHNRNVYDASGNFVRTLNIGGTEHSCLGKLSNGADAYFAISFEEGPSGGCQGTLVVHNATTGACYSATPVSDYTYPQSGTHMSALAHNNTEGGWVAVSSMGFDLDGQDILDQELFIAKAGPTSADVYRVAHHRSDEDEFDYWGEPHVTISPSGTRLLFGSDWSGPEDGDSVDAYVAELQANTLSNTPFEDVADITLYPNPVKNVLNINTSEEELNFELLSVSGNIISQGKLNSEKKISVSYLSQGLYFIRLKSNKNRKIFKFIK